MVKIIALIGLVSVSGCVSPLTHQWVKDGASAEDFASNRARCQYEAKLATANYSSGRPGISGGIAEGLEMGSRENELTTLCMQGKGYRVERKP